MKTELSDELFTMLYFGTRNAQKMRKALNEAENTINTFLEPDDGTTKQRNTCILQTQTELVLKLNMVRRLKTFQSLRLKIDERND